MTTVVEIQTIESGRIEWVAIMSSTHQHSAIEWGESLLRGMGDMKPNLRVTDGLYGPVTGAWQAEGYEPAP